MLLNKMDSSVVSVRTKCFSSALTTSELSMIYGDLHASALFRLQSDSVLSLLPHSKLVRAILLLLSYHEFFSFRYNQLTEIPAGLSNCTKLTEFNVENNQLTTLPVS